jgi:hypothetical protein
MTGAGKHNTPFFLVGCVRSGTTILRDMLRQHPRLECPEETHFFRWGEVFGTPGYRGRYLRNKLVDKHIGMDGITKWELGLLLKFAASKRHFAEEYGRLYLKKQNNPEGRWFDKTPQNVYGILEISAAFPECKFVHIYRNPLNVVSSLMEGRVMPAHDIRGAINFWTEALGILTEFKQGFPGRLLEIAYEDFTTSPKKILTAVLDFVGEDPRMLKMDKKQVHREKNKYKALLDKDQIQQVKEGCEPYLSLYGYK